MKSLFFLFCLLFASTNAFPQNNLLLLFGDDDLLPEVNQYYQRVKEDNGEIVIPSNFHKQLKQIKSNNYLDSLVFWVSSYGGLKNTNDSIEILYELRGNDLIGTVGNYPIQFPDNNTNENMIYFPGNSFLTNSIFSIQQPFTLVLTIRQNEPDEEEFIFHSLSNNDYSISTNKKNELTVEAGKKLKAGEFDHNVNTIIIEFNGDDSKVFINNELSASGKLDPKELNGILVGKNNKNKPDYFSGYLYNCGIFNCIISNDFRTNLFNILK